MSKASNVRTQNNTEKVLIDCFSSLCQTRSNWQVWSDFITASACSIANSFDHDSPQYQKREDEYMSCIERLGDANKVAEMFAMVVMALEENPEQDFLGSLFMKLDLGNHWKGQFFTPYSVCKTMAAINSFDTEEAIEKKGWVSINDCACGAGATLIAMANTLKEHGINYQNHALFVAQDIDRIAALMCYIQLSLLGCPGYVVVADSLTNPIVGKTLYPVPQDGQEFWFTPMYESDTWKYRRLFNMMDSFFKNL